MLPSAAARNSEALATRDVIDIEVTVPRLAIPAELDPGDLGRGEVGESGAGKLGHSILLILRGHEGRIGNGARAAIRTGLGHHISLAVVADLEQVVVGPDREAVKAGAGNVRGEHRERVARFKLLLCTRSKKSLRERERERGKWVASHTLSVGGTSR